MFRHNVDNRNNEKTKKSNGNQQKYQANHWLTKSLTPFFVEQNLHPTYTHTTKSYFFFFASTLCCSFIQMISSCLLNAFCRLTRTAAFMFVFFQHCLLLFSLSLNWYFNWNYYWCRAAVQHSALCSVLWTLCLYTKWKTNLSVRVQKEHEKKPN